MGATCLTRARAVYVPELSSISKCKAFTGDSTRNKPRTGPVVFSIFGPPSTVVMPPRGIVGVFGPLARWQGRIRTEATCTAGHLGEGILGGQGVADPGGILWARS